MEPPSVEALRAYSVGGTLPWSELACGWPAHEVERSAPCRNPLPDASVAADPAWVSRWSFFWSAYSPSVDDCQEDCGTDARSVQVEKNAASKTPWHRIGRPSLFQRRTGRLWCQLYLNQRHEQFEMGKALIGNRGANTRSIHERTGANIRLRGRGSGYKEADGKAEAPVPLMIVVISDGTEASDFTLAVRLVLQKLEQINGWFFDFCVANRLELELVDEGSWSFGDMSEDARSILQKAGFGIETRSSRAKCPFLPPLRSGETARRFGSARSKLKAKLLEAL